MGVIEKKHTRKLDLKDKYFIATVKINENQNTEFGWIEKSFNQEQFEKTTGHKAISFIEFENKEQYDLQKYRK